MCLIGRMTEVGGQRTEDRGQRSEDRGRMTEDEMRMTDYRERKADDGGPSSTPESHCLSWSGAAEHRIMHSGYKMSNLEFQKTDGGIASLRYLTRFGCSTLCSRPKGSSRVALGYFAVPQFTAQSRLSLRSVVHRIRSSVFRNLSSVILKIHAT